MQILVADNNDHSRAAICQRLENDGYQTFSAASTDEALHIFRSKNISIIIFDLVLIGMNGLELLSTFKKEKPGCEVITMTSFPSLETVIGAMNRGALDYLIKTGDDFDSLLTTISRAAEIIGARETQAAETSLLLDEINRLREINQNLAAGIKDSRTGLHSASYFNDIFENEFHRAVRNQRQFSIVLVRLNSDINIGNNEFQVRAMDSALPGWSKTIHERLRKSDIVARYDDNTLSIILPETGKDGALLVAECLIQLCDEVTQAVLGEEIEIADLLQVGIASFPDDGESRDKLFDLANKRSGDICSGGSGSVH